MSIINTLKSRLLFSDCTNSLGFEGLPKNFSFYVGFDPTAASLQIGNLVPILASIQLAKLGAKPIMLFGGATGGIGDPSGRSTERPLLSREEINKNISNQTLQMKALFERSSAEVCFVNNFDWTKDVTIIDFLRDIGKHFTISYMLQKESVKSRLSNEGISYTEFSYMLLQASDFLHLYKEHNCLVQVGGSDQWGNITAGVELIRRVTGGESFGLTFPLIVNSDGKKLGKSEGGTLWLDSAMTSPYDFYQYWLNLSDKDALSLLRSMTLLTENEITDIEGEFNTKPHERLAHKVLASKMTTLVHGCEAEQLAMKSASVLFGGDISELSESEITSIFSDVPSTSISHDQLSEPISDICVKIGLCSSKSEVRRLVEQGGLYLDGNRVIDISKNLQEIGSRFKNIRLFRSGKKKYHVVRVA